MKKKIFAISLSAAMLLSLASCGKETETEITPPSNSFNSSKEETPTVAESEEPIATEESVKPIEPLQEILDADLADNKVQIGDYVITFPVSVDNLLSAGVKIIDANPDAIVVRPGTGQFTCFDFGSQTYSFSALNFESDESILLRNCKLYDTRVMDPSNSNVDYATDLIFAKGITVGATVDELKAAWGEPTQVTEFTNYLYLLSDNGYTCTIDLETNTITSISYNHEYDILE